MLIQMQKLSKLDLRPAEFFYVEADAVTSIEPGPAAMFRGKDIVVNSSVVTLKDKRVFVVDKEPRDHFLAIRDAKRSEA